MVSVEVPGQPEVWTGICARIMCCLESGIAIPQKYGKTVAFTIDYKKIADAVVVKIGNAHAQGTSTGAIIRRRSKAAVSISKPNGHGIGHRSSVCHDQVGLPVAVQIGQCDRGRCIAVLILRPVSKLTDALPQ